MKKILALFVMLSLIGIGCGSSTSSPASTSPKATPTTPTTKSTPTTGAEPTTTKPKTDPAPVDPLPKEKTDPAPKDKKEKNGKPDGGVDLTPKVKLETPPK